MRSVSCWCHIYWTQSLAPVIRRRMNWTWSSHQLKFFLVTWNVDDRKPNPPVQLQRSRKFWNVFLVSPVMAFWREIFDTSKLWGLELNEKFRSGSAVFPLGILREPFYNLDLPRYMLYGNLGVVIGHEIVHGFDVNGTDRSIDFFACRCLELFSFTRCALRQECSVRSWWTALNCCQNLSLTSWNNATPVHLVKWENFLFGSNCPTIFLSFNSFSNWIFRFNFFTPPADPAVIVFIWNALWHIHQKKQNRQL